MKDDQKRLRIISLCEEELWLYDQIPAIDEETYQNRLLVLLKLITLYRDDPEHGRARESARKIMEACESRLNRDSGLPRECLGQAGNILLERYMASGHGEDLTCALELCRKAVANTPADSPDLPGYLNNLAAALRNRYECTGDEADLRDAIRNLQKAAETTPSDSPEFPRILSNLGNALRQQFGHTHLDSDLDEAIRFLNQAADITPPDSPELPAYLSNLGIGLISRSERTGREADLGDAIRILRKAAGAVTSDSTEFPRILSNLGNALHKQFGHAHRDSDLDEAICFLNQAVDTIPQASPDLPGILSNLGATLTARSERTGRESDLKDGIQILQRAAEVVKLRPPEFPRILGNLGNALRQQFGHTHRDLELDEAIRFLNQAVDTTPQDSPDLAGLLTDLGSALHARFGRTGREVDLEDTIQVWRQAVAATPPDSPGMRGRLNNLGIALRDRFEHTGRELDLEEAILILQQVADATADDAPDLHRIVTNLGTSLTSRFERTQQETDLEEAIRIFQRGADTISHDSPDLPKILNNLAASLTTRFERTRRETDLEEAIRVIQQAVDATPPDSSDLPMYLTTLGHSLAIRSERLGQDTDLDEAIRVLREAVEATTADSPVLSMYLNNLGISLAIRFERTGQQADLEAAIRVYRRACELGDVSHPQTVLNAARNWGRWALERQQWHETAEAYSYGLATGRQLLARQLLREHKESWLRDMQGMSAGAAYALAKLARCEEAAEVMERGRARLLGEALQRRRRDLERLPALGYEDLYLRYCEVVMRQEQLTQPAAGGTDSSHTLQGQARLDAISAAARDFEQMVADIRQVPGYEDFLAEASFTQIQAAARETIVAYLLATAAGGLALLVTADAVQSVWLESLTDSLVREWLTGSTDGKVIGGWLGAYGNWLAQRTLQGQQTWFAAMEEITHQLWIHLMQPLAEALHQVSPAKDFDDAPAITLIPAGLLALLPLHAAWTEDASTLTGRRYFLDEFTVSYAPSALSLAHARERAKGATVTRLLAIEEPLTVHASRLPNVQAEVTAIAGLFQDPILLADKKATREAVLTALPRADVVHFSCHGSNDWQSPLDSGLLMADDASGNTVMLTVRDLLDAGLPGGRLASLSACETGIVGTKLPDEVVALPSALLQAGYAGVTASLWSVSDISTAMLMEHFYAGWCGKNTDTSVNGDKLTPAQALRAAQRWLRDSTNREKAEYFKRYSPELLAAPGAVLSPNARMPETTAIEFFSRAMSRHQDAREFAHPYWWAAFYMTGV